MSSLRGSYSSAFDFSLTDSVTTINSFEAQVQPSRVHLPSQSAFIVHGLIPASKLTIMPVDGTSCGACLEDFVISQKYVALAAEANGVVYLQPCQHFFHKNCILQWFESGRPERATCPNCRRELFIADPLTAEQIARNVEDEYNDDPRPIGPYRVPGPGEQLVDWEYYTIDMMARCAVRREIDRAVSKGKQHRWIDVCWQVRDKILAECGTLRSVFEPHSDTFVLFACAIPILYAIFMHPNLNRTRAFRAFDKWTDALEDQMGEELVAQLNEELAARGLFESDVIRVATVSRWYVRSFNDATDRFATYLEEKERRRMAKERRNVRALLGRVLRRVLPRRMLRLRFMDLVPCPSERIIE